jgi:general secretion pathway protein I
VRNQRGFTLIEVMVAAAVLGIAATALFSLLSRSLSNIRTIEDLHHYQLAGEDIMNRVLLLSALPPGGQIEGDVKNVRAHWIVTISPWIPQKLENNTPEAVMKVNVQILWPGRSGQQRSIQLETVKAAALSYKHEDFQKVIENALPD